MSGRQRASQTVCREGRTKAPGETCEILMSMKTFKIQKQRQTDLSCRGEWERQGRTGWRRVCGRAFLKNPIHHTGSRLQFSKQNGEHVCMRPYVYYVFACARAWHGEWWMGWFAWKCFANDPQLSMQPVLFIAHLLFLLWLACALWLHVLLIMCILWQTLWYINVHYLL